MPFEITKPVIKKRALDDSKPIVTIDMEKGSLRIEAILEDEYESGIITRTRPGIALRDDRDSLKFTNALNKLLPTAPKEPWVNPRASFIKLLMEILSEEIV